MAKEEKLKKETEKKPQKKQEEDKGEFLIRIMGVDIPGSKNIYAGLTRIKGVSWAISNAVCLKLGYEKSKKISELSKSDIAKIEEFLNDLPVYKFMKNRRFDRDTGEDIHLFGTNLDLKKEFDIKRLKAIKSYKGIRHAAKLPVRGQRTRAHFRSKGKSRAVGVQKKKIGKKA